MRDTMRSGPNCLRQPTPYTERGYLSMPYQFSPESFWRRVDRSGSCWLWTGYTTPTGYGMTSVQGKTRLSHRVVWELTFGPIPDGMLICHTCDNPPCQNPSHLFLGTWASNMADKMAKGRHVPGVTNRATGERHGRQTKPERTARGERAGNVFLTQAEVDAIRRRFEQGERQIDIARSTGLTKSHIHKIIRGKCWNVIQATGQPAETAA